MRSQGLDGKHNVEASSGNTIVVAKKLHVKHYRRIRFWQTGHGKLNIQEQLFIIAKMCSNPGSRRKGNVRLEWRVSVCFSCGLITQTAQHSDCDTRRSLGNILFLGYKFIKSVINLPKM
jgi:hypothetical protein